MLHVLEKFKKTHHFLKSKSLCSYGYNLKSICYGLVRGLKSNCHILKSKTNRICSLRSKKKWCVFLNFSNTCNMHILYVMSGQSLWIVLTWFDKLLYPVWISAPPPNIRLTIYGTPVYLILPLYLYPLQRRTILCRMLNVCWVSVRLFTRDIKIDCFFVRIYLLW
jgi:hypothetical protein